MKRTNRSAVVAALLSTLLLCDAQAEERRGKIDPIIPKAITVPGETKRDKIARILEIGSAPHIPKMHRNVPRLHKKIAEKLKLASTPASQSKTSCKCCKESKKCKNFKNFKGYWLLDNITPYSGITAIEFFEDKCGNTFGRFFDGTQNNLRERNQNDDFAENDFPSDVGDTFTVQVVGPRSLLLHILVPSLGIDDRLKTFRIQDADPNVGYMAIDDDSPEVLQVVLERYIRLPERPDIQLRRLPSKTDWTNPVEIFNYIVEYFAQLGQPQKAVSLNQTDFIGWANYEQLAQTMLTTGITRTAKVSTAYRGDGYIGVWRSRFPDFLPLTTIHTEEVPQFNGCSTVNITGFVGAYSELNGTHQVAVFDNQSRSTPYPWQDPSSRQPFIYLNYDSSGITEAYDPTVHGVATLVAHHGPITPAIGYRDFMAAVLDFGISSFGPGTHTAQAIAVYLDTGITAPETFEQLIEGAAQNTVGIDVRGFRNFSNNGFGLYWNPFALGTGPAFNFNDPFGLGLLVYFDPYFDYDITIENYLDKSTIKNMFFTVTGPILQDQAITGLLQDIGYTSNGSQVVFTANDFQTFPDPLVDEFGTHPYMLFAAADNSPESVTIESQQFFGGMINTNFTGGKKVAYIRIQREPAFDNPFDFLSDYPLVFGRNDIPDKYTNNFVAAWATLLEELNKHAPDRYILDIRSNNGGRIINSALASLFGGDRFSADNSAEAYPGNGQRAPLPLAGSGIQTVFDSVPKTSYILPNDIVAQVFPQSAVRSDEKEIEVIILTSSRAASAGDQFPHMYLGPNPEGTVQDLGHNVKARIVGDIDGRLWSASKGLDAPPIDPLAQNLVNSNGAPRTVTYMNAEGGPLLIDRHGYFVNTTLSTRPNPLLKGWYDQTEWQDLGLTPVIQSYPLGNTKPLPTIEDRSTWRDVWLENAIVN